MRNFSQDIVTLQNLNSPVAQLLSKFLEDAIAAVGEVTLKTYEIADFSDLYRDGHGSGWLLRIRTVPSEAFGSTSIVITAKGYNLIYFPTAYEKDDALQIYAGFRPANQERFKVDDRLVFFEINLADVNIGAKPIVVMADMEQPMTGGKIVYEPFSSAHPDVLSRIVGQMKVSLSSSILKIGGVEFVRRKASGTSQIF